MKLSSPTTVKRALYDTVLGMKTKDGYRIQFLPANVFMRMNQKFMLATKDASYPKCVIQLIEGKLQNEIGGCQSRTMNFAVTVIVRLKDNDATDAVDLIDEIIEDFFLLFQNDDSLRGTVFDAQITDFVTDNGEVAPEAVVIFKVKTEQKG